MKSNAEQLYVKKVTPEAILPTRAHADDAGLDLYAFEDGVIPPGEGLVARTGVAFALPPRSVGLVADRSSMAKRGVKTSGGVIDAGYRGEVHIILRNITTEPVHFTRGERIAQMLILPCLTPAVLETDTLDETTRGTKGFGSTGR
jgi:dUTP pyrophosphatase